MLKTALVTGSAGFVGRHLVPRLRNEGYDVKTLDIKEGNGILKSLPIVKRRYDLVVHLAANIEDVDARIKGTHRGFNDIALDLCVAEYVYNNPPKECLIWPTSCAIDNPNDPYAWVKLTGEKIFGTLSKHNIRVVMLRPFSGYGDDQALSYPFPAILQRAFSKQDPLYVWGSGEQIRDFIHIDDLVEAFMIGKDKFPSGVPVEIGTGRGVSFIQLAKMMAQAVGYKPAINCQLAKAQSSMYRVADPSVAAHYGFKAKVSLEEGIKRSIKAWRDKCTQQPTN